MRVDCLLLATLSACSAPVPDPAPPTRADGDAVVAVLPPAPLDAVQPVTRLVVRRVGLGVGDLKLFEGVLSEYHQRRIVDRELPGTLADREVPTLGWVDGDALVVSPTTPLARGARYTLAALGLGRLAELVVTREAPPIVSRLWPPVGTEGGSDRVVYCGLPFGLASTLEATLEPGGHSARVRPGVDELGLDADNCLTLEPLERLAPGQVIQPPLDVAGFPLDPSPIVVAEASEPPPLDCEGDELRVATGCIRVFDDRLHVRTPATHGLWSFASGALGVVIPAPPKDTFVVRGLTPDSARALQISMRDLAGRSSAEAVVITTAPAMDHVVLNEVLANPIGPEPAQEWVELTNDGTGPADLGGYSLVDTAGQVVLPSFVLEPGAFVVLAREDFVEDVESDVPLLPGTPLLRLPSLGKNGLSNAGEPLWLRRPDGSLASTFPALPKPKPGVTVARRNADSPDQGVGAFSLHAAPGASPGGANALAD